MFLAFGCISTKIGTKLKKTKFNLKIINYKLIYHPVLLIAIDAELSKIFPLVSD
jgi:hypothetical protein